jgi:hypothetical protein
MNEMIIWARLQADDMRSEKYCIGIKRPGPMKSSLLDRMTFIFSY